MASLSPKDSVVLEQIVLYKGLQGHIGCTQEEVDCSGAVVEFVPEVSVDPGAAEVFNFSAVVARAGNTNNYLFPFEDSTGLISKIGAVVDCGLGIKGVGSSAATQAVGYLVFPQGKELVVGESSLNSLPPPLCWGRGTPCGPFWGCSYCVAKKLVPKYKKDVFTGSKVAGASGLDLGCVGAVKDSVVVSENLDKELLQVPAGSKAKCGSALALSGTGSVEGLIGPLYPIKVPRFWLNLKLV